MSSAVAKHIFTFLCKNEGCSDYGKVEKSLRQSFTVADQVLTMVLDDQEKFAIKEDDDSNTSKSVLGAKSLIVAKTSLRVCKNDKCVGCEELHLCRYLVCGNCRFGTKCKKSHDLGSAYNLALLKKQDLQRLTSEELFQLLLQNDPSLLPEVCFHYNKGNGEHGSCKYKTSCTSLHLCLHFLQEDCKFGASCKRAHAFDAYAEKILNGRGIGPENKRNLHKIYRNRLLITSSKDRPVRKTELPALPAVRERTRHKSSISVSEADQNEICLYFLRSGCSFKDKCVRVHHPLPYKWQILQADGVTWSDLANEDEVEKAFCNPASDVRCEHIVCGLWLCRFHSDDFKIISTCSECCSITSTSSGHQIVHFISMTCGGSSVRRLSTASSVTKPPHFILTTQWLWYWKNDVEEWMEYGKGDNTKLVTSVTSETLEKDYISDNEKEVPFDSDKHQYILTFKGMYQRNLKYKTVREIRRRPRFVSAQDAKGKIKGSESSDSSTPSVEVPSYWDKGSLPSFTYMRVPLQMSSKEYLRVSSLFSRTMPRSTIHSIEIVQNLSLWRVFQWQKEQMTGRNKGKEVAQRQLFHGTNEDLIDPICEQNFDWRVCGSHGTLYGKGSYFARDASYSDKYIKSRTNQKKMFLAQVLVGEFTRGQSSLVRPPAKTSKSFYDSCVDSETNPAIFVVFEKFQVYPEFIIEYS
ncbi:protein mono-ADP-ribosyltransferase PARP12-like isoform X2 [Triplophysa dalaica]|uniref:protein mono-ADP-ribosyltransferase PARP12-like isoform X2 n=1 Tax=Triplophysa dalaica TaxID=1582913 RepID=UPI0024DFE796|nr:protein mono-ADP-ribosyltransferase PARP12-like isoform X2 [Triplophysa dalaica]